MTSQLSFAVSLKNAHCKQCINLRDTYIDLGQKITDRLEFYNENYSDDPNKALLTPEDIMEKMYERISTDDFVYQTIVYPLKCELSKSYRCLNVLWTNVSNFLKMANQKIRASQAANEKLEQLKPRLQILQERVQEAVGENLVNIDPGVELMAFINDIFNPAQAEANLKKNDLWRSLAVWI